jgi:hypothetical protein
MTLTCLNRLVAQSRAARAQRPALASVGVPWRYAGSDKFAASPDDRMGPSRRINRNNGELAGDTDDRVRRHGPPWPRQRPCHPLTGLQIKNSPHLTTVCSL